MNNPEEFQLATRDGFRLYGQKWATDSPVAIICIVHGLGEHIGRYQHIVDFFLSHQMAVFGIDLRGHGLSEGKRGHMSAYEDFLGDIELMMMYARATFNDSPMFLFAHSLGGNLAINFVLKKNVCELKGAIVSSPWLQLTTNPPAWEKLVTLVLSKVWLSFTQSSHLEVDALTNDKELNERYANDPLVHDKISAKMFVEVYSAGLFAIANGHLNKLPLLVYHGDNDQITNAKASKAFTEKAHGDVTFKIWEGIKHEPHNDVRKDEVLALMYDWMKKRMK